MKNSVRILSVSSLFISQFMGVTGYAAPAPDLGGGRYLDHDETVAQGGVGNIVDRSSVPPSETQGAKEKADQEPGTYAGKGDASASSSDEYQDPLNVRSQIHFDTGDASLSPHSDPQLNRITEELKKDPHLQVVIEGHADSKGSPDENRKISEARANAVKSELISRGIPASKIETYGFGSSEPLASNSSVEGRAENRRADLYLQDMESAT